MQSFDSSQVWLNKKTRLQDAQKGQMSHEPRPGALRRAVPRARPQRAKRRGVGFDPLSL